MLHWTTALLFLCLILVGFAMARADAGGEVQFALYQMHKSLGLCALVLTSVRIAWRLAHPAPALPDALPTWSRRAARSLHAAFYVLLLAIPLIGWALVSASPLPVPTVLFGLVEIPRLWPFADLDRATRVRATGTLSEIHAFLAYGTAALVAVHVAAALGHRRFGGVDVLVRMLPRPTSARGGGP